jgi:hypothetical protein
MSNLNAVALVLAILIADGFLTTYLSIAANRRLDVALSGLVAGIPASQKHRRVMLYNMYVGYVGGIIGLCVFVAFGLVEVAHYVNEPRIKNLAYAGAILAGFPALTWSILGTSAGLHCAKVLRQTGAD